MGLRKVLTDGSLAIACAIGLGTATASAADLDLNLGAAAGFTSQGQMTWRADVSRDWSKRWWQGERGYLTGYWDAGYTYWEGGDEGSGAHSLSFSPVLVYQFHGERYRPFIEGGIGIALFSSTGVADRDMGSALQFEDRLAAGLVLPGGSRVGVRAIHYSNAGLKNPNEGIESYSLFYTHSF